MNGCPRRPGLERRGAQPAVQLDWAEWHEGECYRVRVGGEPAGSVYRYYYHDDWHVAGLPEPVFATCRAAADYVSANRPAQPVPPAVPPDPPRPAPRRRPHLRLLPSPTGD